MPPLLRLDQVSKSFTLHLRAGARLDIVSDVSFEVAAGECVVLGGPSGAGKSSVLKMIFGNYRCEAGTIEVRDGDELVDMSQASPLRILQLRRSVMGYVSQFLRVIPRVPALDIVAAAGRQTGQADGIARRRAAELLVRLNLPERLWRLPPATFSGGEQQRVNIARGLIADLPLLLLDEPTASLDAENRRVVVELIEAKKTAGVAVLGIFHDEEVRGVLATRVVDMTCFRARTA